jgi:2-hydroxy-3-oxopropionate reductase
MSSKIALIGAGVMGNAIATRLLEMGNQLNVYDRNQFKIDALVEKGATAATSAASAAATADYIILSLNNAATVSTVVFGQSGVAERARPGAQIIDMSSIDPISTKALAAQAQDKGLRWLDCPLSGGAPKALAGELTVMAGGDEADFNAASIVMNQLCANFTLMGSVGAGQTTKLINQVLCGLHFVAVAEATQLAIDAGMDARKIPQALKGGRADSAILQEFMAKMATKDYSPTGRIDNMVKDLNSVQDLARSTNTAMPLTSVCAEIYRHLMHSGFGGDDNAALMKFYAKNEE